MLKVKGETKNRFASVEVFEDEMMNLSDKMAKHSLVCTVTRLNNTLDRVVEEENVVDKKLEDMHCEEGMEEPNIAGQIVGWKEMELSCSKTVNDVAGVAEIFKGKRDQMNEDISLLIEKRNSILMSTT